MDNLRDFLEAMENSGNLLFEEGGKEGEKIDASVKKALVDSKISYLWAYQPANYDLVVLEHEKDGEKKSSWSTVFFTEAELGTKGEPEEDIFKESLNEAKAAVGMKIVDQAKGNFLDTVQLCIELASNKQYKGGFTAQKAQKAVSASKSKK